MTENNLIQTAVNILKRGGLVAIPTETVYGLGADASNESAIRKIFAAKERPFDHPLIVHLANIDQLSVWAREISPAAYKLATACWPGPLTMILKKQPQVLDVVTGHQDTVGIRIPRHPVAQELLTAFGQGIAAPSANKFTHISPTTAQAVQEELGDKVDLILDGGACEVGLESTIIDMTQAMPVILRPGMITAEEIAKILDLPVHMGSSEHKDIPRVPGMHHLHYAPTTHTIMLATTDIPSWIKQLNPQDLPVALIHRQHISSVDTSAIHTIKMPDDAASFAHDLYHVLRTLDQQQFKLIVIEEVPLTNEWDAIRDRLNKATR